MADDIQVTPGTGATIAADDVGGKLHQRIKLCLGADGAAVDAVAGAGVVSTAVQRVTLASDAPAHGVTAGGAAPAQMHVIGGVYNVTSPVFTDGQAGALRVGSDGSLSANVGSSALPTGAATAAKQDALAGLVGEVQASPTSNTVLDRLKALLTGIVLAAGANVVGKVGIDQTTDGTTNLVAAKQSGTWNVTAVTGTPAHYLSAASTNATVVKASAGTILNITAINTTATVYYLKLHDTASTPTAGSTAVVQCYAIPASTSGNGFVISVPIAFASGVAFTCVGGIADNDSSNAATGIAINFVYR